MPRFDRYSSGSAPVEGTLKAGAAETPNASEPMAGERATAPGRSRASAKMGGDGAALAWSGPTRRS